MDETLADPRPHRPTSHRILRGLLIGYAILGLLSLLLVPASLYGWLGSESDPLSGVFALLLAMPWTILLTLLGDIGTWGSLAFSAAAIALNVAIGWILTRPRRKGDRPHR